jgi:hypothetical protein
MSLRPVHASFTISWLTHDSWSEAYVGTRRLVYDILPPSIAQQTAEDAALCQLSLIGANHLMEVALARLLKPFASTHPTFTTRKYKEASYWLALSHWVPALSGMPLLLDAEPFSSTERLRVRRNATAHKSSALATVPMARSALFSAVEGSKALYAHFGVEFPYELFFSKFPCPSEQPFSTVPFPPST